MIIETRLFKYNLILVFLENDNVRLSFGVNKAKIRYLSPLFGVSQKESAERPDRINLNA